MDSLEKVMISVTIKEKYNLNKGLFMTFFTFLKKTFAFDDRSMGLYRILIGLVVMADVLYRWEDLANFYTDTGLIPRSIFTSEMSMPWSLSFHLANGSYPFIVAMFLVHLIFGLMLVFGYKSRWAMIGAYLMTVSVHNRNWLVNNGGDDVLRAILFLSIFLPLNRRFSLDAALKRDKPETTEYFSAWNLAFFFQVFAIYFVSYILKDHAIWRTDWTAFFFSSRLDIFSTPFGVWLRNFPTVGKLITGFSIYLEWLGPLLLVLNFAFGRFWWIPRTVISLIFIGFHFGIFLTMNIGLFTFICESMWVLFLPAPFWDLFANRARAKNLHKLKVYFDGDCGFCQKSARMIKEFLLMKETEVLEAQKEPAIFAQMKENWSWVVVNERDERFFHYKAFLELLRHSSWLSWTLFFFRSGPVSALGEKVYNWVSHHRDTMGKGSQFLEYTTAKKEIPFLKWIREAAGAFMLVTLVMWNLTTIKKWNIKAPFFQNVTRWIHLYQEWNMFAPFPKMDNIWVEIPATLSDGTEVELLSGSKDIYSIKDQSFVKGIRNEHWRKFYLNLSERHDYARYYGGYICRQWNDKKERFMPDLTLRKFEIVVYSQPNLPDGEKGGISRKLSWRHWCFDEDFKRDNPGETRK